MDEMSTFDDGPTFNERTSLSDRRSAASALTLVLVLGVRAYGAPVSIFPVAMLGLALVAGILALWEASSRYIWREDPDHRTPRPWSALTVAISVMCSCIAGISLSFSRLPSAIDQLLR